MEEFDVLIVGSGPAGLTAALYAQRYAMKTIVIGKSFGQAGDAIWIENYPTIKSISGVEFINLLIDQVTSLGTRIEFDEIKSIKKQGNYFIAKTDSNEFKSKTVILGVGKRSRKLEVKGEKELLGKGVSYCTTCEGAFYKEKTVAIVGGGDAALTGALMLAQHAKKVYLIHRRNEFSAEPVWQQKVKSEKKIELILNAGVSEIKGKGKVESIVLNSDSKQKELKADGIFIEVGHIPNDELAKQLGLAISKEGLIKVDAEMKSSVKGVFACGDIIDLIKLKQIIVSSATGAIAANSAFNYIESEFK